jgi:hypothetical protein
MSDRDVVIRVEGVSKLYRLGEVGTGSLAHDFNRWWHRVRGKEDPYLKVGEVNDRTKSAKQTSADGGSQGRDVKLQGGISRPMLVIRKANGAGVLKGHLQARLEVGLQKRRQTVHWSCQHRLLHP